MAHRSSFVVLFGHYFRNYRNAIASSVISGRSNFGADS